MQFLVAIFHPADHDETKDDPAMSRAISELNEEMVKAGIRRFVGGLQPIHKAKAIRTKDGKAFISDGPYIETKEFFGGFWVLELASMEDALEWGRKASAACRTSVEVRPFH